jgi:hypothetical protein
VFRGEKIWIAAGSAAQPDFRPIEQYVA